MDQGQGMLQRLYYVRVLTQEIIWGNAETEQRDTEKDTKTKRQRVGCNDGDCLKGIVHAYRETMLHMATLEMCCIWWQVVVWLLSLSH